ncbi:hypothetical protein ACRAWG_07560 [Methylobacterium sp. P31]
MPGRARRRYTTFLISVTTDPPGDGVSGATVYAVMKSSAGEALEAVRALAEPQSAVTLVGSLSTRVAKGLKLKPDEMRAV